MKELTFRSASCSSSGSTSLVRVASPKFRTSESPSLFLTFTLCLYFVEKRNKGRKQKLTSQTVYRSRSETLQRATFMWQSGSIFTSSTMSIGAAGASPPRHRKIKSLGVADVVLLLLLLLLFCCCCRRCSVAVVAAATDQRTAVVAVADQQICYCRRHWLMIAMTIHQQRAAVAAAVVAVVVVVVATVAAAVVVVADFVVPVAVMMIN